jgi:hypothetical protein
MSDFNLIDIINLIRAEIRKTQIGPMKKVIGPQGPQGIQGESGSVGPQGPRGNDGKPGPMGPKGNQGRKGDKGNKGEDGKDGVGIARVEQDIDNAILVILTDGTTYTIEMPIVEGDNPTEVHYKVSGGGSGGTGSGTVDLSGYVRRPPSELNDSWLVYKETNNPDGKGVSRIWTPVTTDLVATNPEAIFRNSKGQFRSVKDYEELTNQLKVNRFIADELELINKALASLASGSVVVSDDPPDIEADGQLWLDSNRLELFISYEEAWISTTPLAARVEAGEAVQASIIEALDEGIREQTRIRSRVGDLEANKIGRTGTQALDRQAWSLNQDDNTFISIHNGKMNLDHVDTPTSAMHGVNRLYVDQEIAKVIANLPTARPAQFSWKYGGAGDITPPSGYFYKNGNNYYLSLTSSNGLKIHSGSEKSWGPANASAFEMSIWRKNGDAWQMYKHVECDKVYWFYEDTSSAKNMCIRFHQKWESNTNTYATQTEYFITVGGFF